MPRLDRLPGLMQRTVPLADAPPRAGGGLVLDDRGHAVGLLFGSYSRRGRLMSIPHGNLRRAIATTGAAPMGPAAGDAGKENVRAHAASPLRDGTVAQVCCSA